MKQTPIRKEAPILKEAHRQSYLRALGLTPWVARVPLPGAAPSEPLNREQETDPSVQPMADAVPAAAAPRPAASTPPLRADLETAAAPVREAPASAAPKPAVSGAEALVFTLEVHLAGGTWVVFEQEDAQAPELGRHSGALAASLLAVYGGARQRPRRFYCPLVAGQPTGAGEAGEALRAFLDGLAGRHGGERVLLCIDEALGEALFGAPRYQPFRFGERPALAISTLQQMLADPVRHKAASWRAMRSAGFGVAR